MRRRKQSESVRLTLLRGGAGVEESGYASTTYGCESQGGITWHRTQSHQLSELLNDLEKEAQILESRFLEACATLNIVMARLVELGLFGSRINITEEEEGK